MGIHGGEINKNKSPYMSEVILSCFHRAEFEPIPVVGDKLYCRRCGDYQQCLVTIAEWYIKCNTKTCHVKARYGTDEHRARRIATRHVLKYPSHVVTVYQDGVPIDDIRSNGLTFPGYQIVA